MNTLTKETMPKSSHYARRISVSVSVSDNFCQHLAVVAASIIDHAAPEECFVFHVLTKAVSEDSVTRLRKLEDECNHRCSFVFHVVDKRRFDGFPQPSAYVTREMYYRYLLPELLSDEDRTIYMDVDLLVLDSLAPLWELDLGNNLLAAVNDRKPDSEGFRKHKLSLGMKADATYFNSGVLVMNLAALREFGFCEKCLANTAKYSKQIIWPDQDVINLTLEGRILELPERFNCMRPKGGPKDIAIRHFTNYSAKPWCGLYKNKTWPRYLKYLRRTPYRDRVWAFLWIHIKGLFYFRYIKKGIERTLVCGILVRKRRIAPGR